MVDIKDINRAFFLIKQKLKKLEREGIKKYNLKIQPKEFNYLVWICERGRKTLSELASDLYVEKATISNAITRLITKKLLKKQQSKTDKRKIYLVPTEKGRKYLDAHNDIHNDINKRLVKVFTTKELEILLALGHKANSML